MAYSLTKERSKLRESYRVIYEAYIKYFKRSQIVEHYKNLRMRDASTEEVLETLNKLSYEDFKKFTVECYRQYFPSASQYDPVQIIEILAVFCVTEIWGYYLRYFVKHYGSQMHFFWDNFPEICRGATDGESMWDEFATILVEHGMFTDEVLDIVFSGVEYARGLGDCSASPGYVAYHFARCDEVPVSWAVKLFKRFNIGPDNELWHVLNPEGQSTRYGELEGEDKTWVDEMCKKGEVTLD